VTIAARWCRRSCLGRQRAGCVVLLTAVALTVIGSPGVARAQGSAGAGTRLGDAIDAGIDPTPYEKFQSAFQKAEEVQGRRRRIAARIREIEAGTYVDPVVSVGQHRANLRAVEKELEQAQDTLEAERRKLSPDDRVSIAILNLASLLTAAAREMADLADRLRGTTPPQVSLDEQLRDAERYVACFFMILDLRAALRYGGAGNAAFDRFDEAVMKARQLIEPRIADLERAIEDAKTRGDLPKDYHFRHAVYHRALAKGDHEQRAAGLPGDYPLSIRFGGCLGAGCPEEERQKGRTR
jgi:hypothetical protein